MEPIRSGRPHSRVVDSKSSEPPGPLLCNAEEPRVPGNDAPCAGDEGNGCHAMYAVRDASPDAWGRAPGGVPKPDAPSPRPAMGPESFKGAYLGAEPAAGVCANVAEITLGGIAAAASVAANRASSGPDSCWETPGASDWLCMMRLRSLLHSVHEGLVHL